MSKPFALLAGRVAAIIFLLLPPGTSIAAEAEDSAPASTLPAIPQEPQTVDPASLVPEKLAVTATVDFEESSLREVAQWVQKHTGATVRLDQTALSDANIPLDAPVSDHLSDAPVYLLLNRLASLGLAWFIDDDVVHITTAENAVQRLRTHSYAISDLLDDGYEPRRVMQAMQSLPDALWEQIDGTGGTVEHLGEALSVRQTAAVHREINGLLAALRKHGEQTYTLDPTEHIRIRNSLDKKLNVQFVDTPLASVVSQLGRQTGIDIRVDTPAGGRLRDPVSLKLANRKLRTVLHALLAELKLSWILRDGVLWITTADRAERHQKMAVYDVRDLCSDEHEATELQSAVEQQTVGQWQSADGTGGRILFPRLGTMLVLQTGDVHREIRGLLRRHRAALRAQNLRDSKAVDPQ